METLQKRTDTPRGVRVARWVFFCLALGICIFIFMNSAANAEESGGESLAVTELIARGFVKDFADLPAEEQGRILDGLHGYVRTAAHFSEYAALGFFVMLFLLSFGKEFCPDPAGRWRRYLTGYGFCVLYAMSDEIHQLFVDGRVADAGDVAIDSLGALAGCLGACFCGWLVFVFIRRFRRRHSVHGCASRKNQRLSEENT